VEGLGSRPAGDCFYLAWIHHEEFFANNIA
jgi:hypothetical protein